MRRPLKPFVTEYKHSNRRTPTQQAEQVAHEADRPAPKFLDMTPRDSEDSYEAALRAADALFSGRPGNGPQEQELARPNDPSPADMSAAEKNGGRILRVIDEDPSPQLAALEAERAPKRRGRKPGSKNKPKVALLSEAAQTPEAQGVTLAALSPSLPTFTKHPVAQLQALAVPTKGVRRAGWGRDRLRPGEDWKRRRLPRVCW